MPRKLKTVCKAQAEQTLTEAAPHAAQHLNLIAQGRLEKPNPVRVDVCKYVLNQTCGMPTQKTILAGDKEHPVQVSVFIMPDGSKFKLGDLVATADKKALESS